jgi:hypothetical protein
MKEYMHAKDLGEKSKVLTRTVGHLTGVDWSEALLHK